MVFKTGDEDEFESMTIEEFEELEEGDVVTHVHGVPDPKAVENDDLDISDGRRTLTVVSVGDHNPLAGGRMQVRLQYGTISRNNIDKWTVVEKASDPTDREGPER